LRLRVYIEDDPLLVPQLFFQLAELLGDQGLDAGLHVDFRKSEREFAS
jgi:hypothetical protein